MSAYRPMFPAIVALFALLFGSGTRVLAEASPWTTVFSDQPDGSLVRRMTVVEGAEEPAGAVVERSAKPVNEAQAIVWRATLSNPAEASKTLGPATLAEWAFRGDGSQNAGYALLRHNEGTWYDSTFWQGGESWLRVGKDWHHPGDRAPSVRRFTAPRDGTVRITGRVYKLHLQGDGVGATILHSGKERGRGASAKAGER